MTKERKGQISNRGQKETTDRVGASSSKTNPSRARKTLRSEVWTKPRRSVLPETDAAKTFEWLAREYLKTQTRRLSPESLNRVRKIIQANLITFFGCKDSVDTFTPADVARYISDRIKVVSAASAARYGAPAMGRFFPAASRGIPRMMWRPNFSPSAWI